MPTPDLDFTQRLAALEERIDSAALHSGRARGAITLVAVTKKFTADRIALAYSFGLRDFGENYVQEFAEKQPLTGALAGARYHFIGHLQSNKARLACQLFQVVQTVDSVKLLERLNQTASEIGVSIETMIEVKLSGEEAKAGAPPNAIPSILEAAERCPCLSLTGLMTMPPWSENPEDSRPYFRQLASLARQHDLPKLSMGMSGDLEVAIEEGATIVRVGTALFGKRPKPSSA